MKNNTKNLELKIFVTAMLLQELLDETQGEAKFKYRMRHHINGISKELDTLLSITIDDNTSILINKAISALENTIKKEL